ncbi:MAG TPA: hypothetical protein VHR42_06635 [Clostridia bacterium]|nr:hypothetical protein [Clostridia bacterium]
MTKNEIILITIAFGVMLVFAAAAFFAYAAKKRWPVGGVLTKAETSLKSSQSFVEALKPFIPVRYETIAEKVITFAQTAVAGAAQLYKIGVVEKDKRKAQATDFVRNALLTEGIQITPEIEKLISLAIEGAVYALDQSCGKA